MENDPVLREVYRMKDELNREVGGDVGRLFDLLREFARQHPERMVSLAPPRKTRGRKPARAKS